MASNATDPGEALHMQLRRSRKENERLRAENEALKRLVRDLRDVGTFAVAHDFEGYCPDKLIGCDKRDIYCPACKVLLAADDALRGEGKK